MRISAIDVGNIVKTLNEFDNTNTFIMREIPQTILESKKLPFAQITFLGNSPYDYASNFKCGELSESQIDIYVKDNKTGEKLTNSVEKALKNSDFEVYFIDFSTNYEYDFQVLHLRVRRYQIIK
ncbi:head-tail adaptor protein [Ligilactobacillus salivarius]|uniref:head-tail adaptor protein n=1 Tax=Ligilactobacillus salivarius TaxID=1624 RepID=UPI0034DB2D87